MKFLTVLVPFLWLLSVRVSAGPGCGPCDPAQCASLPAEGCPVGSMLDSCGCCSVCAAAEGEMCGGRRAAARRCGSGLECVKSDEDKKSKVGVCACKSNYEVCGTDGVTYRTGCALKTASLTAENQGKEPIHVQNKGEVYNVSGSQVYLSCEAVGVPHLSSPGRGSSELTLNELKDAHWLYDTPGIMKERDILNLLTEQEVMSVVPSQAVVPRTFVLKPGSSLFVGAMARIDFLQGGKSCWFSVVASGRVPVHITSLEKADAIYEKHAGHILLGVPLGGLERMKDFPPLVPQEYRLEGRGYLEAAADIKLSSAGWVAVTAPDGDQLVLRVHGPEAAGFSLRTPPLLPHVIALKGERIRKTAATNPSNRWACWQAGCRTVVQRGCTCRRRRRRRRRSDETSDTAEDWRTDLDHSPDLM
ncbi:Nitric oxide-associated protein 1 [Collichthys lucidus]|uniref:Nitric oxide-associated protein 1 n=1 Tax=Collichthys lucidus TaxID=240159 RepID=A0A4U5TTZ4_COLLU|nr:Nitric oxide-associated protein 1 [Collichthys lucidus]